ncbi:uncharacterized protein LOC104907578 [Beta vulgaris subsp. vulgaris]|uniref:uncharacterized protein LOC104907578 n=1 Tax=Beta vulgaris subsp. vulgaris TaxID=3555 RepID=UPI002036F7F1|nr:uncharacterized protein LOC104907578 [Beta vulgaris subsp. vulgaris]XP_057250222.1 uncharacterized protein LOC104907578 [Beta vulgaris subsp. vulgaris]
MGKKTIGNRNFPKRRGLRSSLGDRAKESEVTGVTGTSHTDEHVGHQDERSDASNPGKVPGNEGTDVGKPVVTKELAKSKKRVKGVA